VRGCEGARVRLTAHRTLAPSHPRTLVPSLQLSLKLSDVIQISLFRFYWEPYSFGWCKPRKSLLRGEVAHASHSLS
jgi:hypothetical protein